ncbi:MAG TPA: class I SAM-dependent methyltransferase [Solirubrobacteraceae bacterium]|nr:class I SAM-dependent methyltransferase [Solirubrobacteraceae bacterium]
MTTPDASLRRCPFCDGELPVRPSIVGGDRLLGLPGRFEVRTCSRCGAGTTEPQLAEEELAALYPEGYGSHAGGSAGVLGRALAALKRLQAGAILRSRPFTDALAGAPGVALDVGCARGELAGALIARGWRVAGIEPSAQAAAVAGTNGVEVLAPTLSRAPLRPGSYDLVIMRHSLEHLADPVSDLRRVREALAAGGRVAVSLPNYASWQRRAFRGRWFHLDLPRHRTHLGGDALARALRAAGLEPLRMWSSTSVLGLPASLQYALVGRCIAPGGLKLRALAAVCCVCYPLTWALDGAGGERDTLHALAVLRR